MFPTVHPDRDREAASRTPTVDEIVRFLERVPVAAPLSPAELAELAFVADILTVAEGERILRFGDPGDAWFLLMYGTAIVSRNGVPLDTLAPGDCFGELAVLDGEHRTADVTAESDVVLVRVPREAFEALLQAGSLAAYKLVLGLTRLVARRLRDLVAPQLPAHTDFQRGSPG